MLAGRSPTPISQHPLREDALAKAATSNFAELWQCGAKFRGGWSVWNKKGCLVLAALSLMLAVQCVEGQEDVKMKCYEGESYNRFALATRLPLVYTTGLPLV